MPKISPEQTISRELALHIALATTVVNLAVRKMPPGDPRADLAVMMHLNGADPTVAWKVCGEPGSVANIRMRAKRERAKRGEIGPIVCNTHTQPEMSPEGMFWTKDGPICLLYTSPSPRDS